MIIRMFEAMEREGYSGGIIFAWMDEWAKKDVDHRTVYDSL